MVAFVLEGAILPNDFLPGNERHDSRTARLPIMPLPSAVDLGGLCMGSAPFKLWNLQLKNF
jgi:hypothetical protein